MTPDQPPAGEVALIFGSVFAILLTAMTLLTLEDRRNVKKRKSAEHAERPAEPADGRGNHPDLA